MVNFGKKIMADQIQEWNLYYINYKLMKKKLKQYAHQTQAGREDNCQVIKEFSNMLDDQIEKIVLFLLGQQGILASRIQELGEQKRIHLERQNISKLCELQESYQAVGHDLLRLLWFVDMNATGLRKILKKFDKRFQSRFTDYYVTSRSTHPYSQLKQVFKHVGIGAVVGALSRNLADLQEHQGNYLSIYDQPSSAVKDPVIDQIYASLDKLNHSTNFLQFLGQHALIVQEDATSLAEANADDQKYHFISLLLNLINTFLYMVNTYIIVPTADGYALSLGAAATVCGVIIGSMAVAQLFSSVFFSQWSNRSYFRPLVFSSIVLFLGNILYALAYDLNSIAILLIGRLLCGLGSARAVNRRYISDCVPQKIRMEASAGFVSASALGIACGPALAGLLQTDFKIYTITFNKNTLPGWLMALAWFIYLLFLSILFREPSHEAAEKHLQENSIHADLWWRRPDETGGKQCMIENSKNSISIEQVLPSSVGLPPNNKEKSANKIIFDFWTKIPGTRRWIRWTAYTKRCVQSSNDHSKDLMPDPEDLDQPLLSRSNGKQYEGGDYDVDDGDEFSRASKGTATSIASAYRLLTPCVKVQLLIYFMLKYAMETLLAESSIVTTIYFSWSTSKIALFLAILGLTVLPVNAVVGSYISNMFEDRQILLASEIMVLVGIILSFHFTGLYSVPQYVSSALITFVSAVVLEGVNLSLLSRVMSSRLACGTYNGGLLSTEAGTLARVFADGSITLAGYLGDDQLLNATLLPSLLICLASILATFLTYSTLY